MRAEPAATLSFLHFESKITFLSLFLFLHSMSKVPFFSFVQLQFPNFFLFTTLSRKIRPKKHEYDYFEVSSLHTRFLSVFTATGWPIHLRFVMDIHKATTFQTIFGFWHLAPTVLTWCRLNRSAKTATCFYIIRDNSKQHRWARSWALGGSEISVTTYRIKGLLHTDFEKSRGSKNIF